MKLQSIYSLALAAAVLAATIPANAQEHENKSTRPQLSATEADAYSYAEVLKYTGRAGNETLDPWDPLSDDLARNMPKPDYTVDAQAKANGHTTFNTVQAAVNQAVADSGKLHTKRIVILVQPGTYHELVYVPASPIPIALYGGDADAGKTVISANLDAAIPGADYAQRFGAEFAQTVPEVAAMYTSVKNKPMVETVGSAIVWIRNKGFQAKNITFENAYNKERGDSREECPPGGCASVMVNGKPQVVHHQAVAAMVDDADRVHFDNVRFIGYQDTLYLKSAETGLTARSFFDKTYIEGDVDFIFGDTTAYFYRSEIKSLGDRNVSYMAAPATNYLTKYGFVFDHCRFTNDGTPTATTGKFYLARQWFHSQRCTPYAPLDLPGYACKLAKSDGYTAPNGTISKRVLETVGKVVILHSQIGSHINQAHPWSNWNSKGTLAYRPAQYDSDDYWMNLVSIGIDPHAMLGYDGKKVPMDHFLAEFENTQD